MTDEEKKAVDRINKLVKYLRKYNENVTIVPEDTKYFEKILDMIKTYIRMIDENIEEILEQSKEIEELKDKINKSIGHINSCKTSLGNYILSPNETEYLLKVLGGLDE